MSQSRLNPGLWLLIGLVTMAGLAGATYFVTRPQYAVYVGESVISVPGPHGTVGEVLAAAGLDLQPQDMVTPARAQPARPEEAIRVVQARPVEVRLDSGGATYWTTQTTLGAFLSEAGIEVRGSDRLAADGSPVGLGRLNETPLPASVVIQQTHTVTILDGQQRRTISTQARTVGEALQEAGIPLYSADVVEPPPGAWIEPDLTITVQHSAPLTIHVDGQVLQTRSAHTNVLDVLAAAGIGLVGQDYTRPGPETELQPGDTIEVIRVTEDFRLEEEPLPFQTLLQPLASLEIDQRQLVSQGQAGTLQRRIRLRYENGVQVSESIDAEWTAVEPVNEVMGYGTQIIPRTVDTPEGPLEYWRKVRMRVTSYTAASSGKDPGDAGYGITASGLPAGNGVVAIDRAVVPFRSWVYVPGYGRAIAGDTGGGVRGRWIDLGYDEDEFVSWSGYVDVYYLTPAPAPDDINYLIPGAAP